MLSGSVILGTRMQHGRRPAPEIDMKDNDRTKVKSVQLPMIYLSSFVVTNPLCKLSCRDFTFGKPDFFICSLALASFLGKSTTSSYLSSDVSNRTAGIFFSFISCNVFIIQIKWVFSEMQMLVVSFVGTNKLIFLN